MALRLLAAGGHEDVIPVPEQSEPDGRFPTLPFPNPEEPGALNLAERLATERGASLVLANDPDADRLGVSVPDANGGWRRLTGNEIGVLLGDFVLERTTGPNRLVVTTVVSTPMLAAVAAHHGANHAVTLTGFKWICNAALDLEATGKRFVFGFEEALGYTIGPVVRDKDGMSAALWFADLAAACAAAGETVRGSSRPPLRAPRGVGESSLEPAPATVRTAWPRSSPRWGVSPPPPGSSEGPVAAVTDY
jgi:phosphomannomutase